MAMTEEQEEAAARRGVGALTAVLKAAARGGGFQQSLAADALASPSVLLARTAAAEAADPKLSEETRAALEADHLLSPEDTAIECTKQAAVVLLLNRLRASFSKANPQTCASLCPLLIMYYAQAIVGGAQRVGSQEPPPRVAGMDGRLDVAGAAFDCFWCFAPIFLPALDLVQALLAVDPGTGKLDVDGVVEGRIRATVDERRGRTRLELNEAGGVEGAMRRPARLREYLERRAARSGLERELLAWLWRDPVCGRSIEEWLWGCEVEEAGLPVDEEGRNFVTITWTAAQPVNSSSSSSSSSGGGESSAAGTSTSTVTLGDIEEDLETWAFQLGQLAFLLAAVVDAEVGALGREADVDLMAHGRGLSERALDRLDAPLEQRLSSLALKIGGESRLVWLGHTYDSTDQSATCGCSPSTRRPTTSAARSRTATSAWRPTLR